jgi:hypothetical protein
VFGELGPRWLRTFATIDPALFSPLWCPESCLESGFPTGVSFASLHPKREGRDDSETVERCHGADYYLFRERTQHAFIRGHPRRKREWGPWQWLFCRKAAVRGKGKTFLSPALRTSLLRESQVPGGLAILHRVESHFCGKRGVFSKSWRGLPEKCGKRVEPPLG